MEVFTNTLEMQYQMSAADAAKVRKIARSLPPGRAERVQVDGVGVGPATNTLEITNDRVTSWSNWVGVDPRVPAEAGGWHTVQSRNRHNSTVRAASSPLEELCQSHKKNSN